MVLFKQLSRSWKSLKNAQILAWNALALSQAGKRILGISAKLTGSNLYMLLNYWIVYCSGTGVVNPQLSKVSRLLLSQLSLSVQHNDSTAHKHPLFCSQHQVHHPSIRISE